MSNPESWPVAQLSDLAEVNPESLRSGTSPNERFWYIDLSSASRGSISWWDVHETDFAHAPSRARRLVNPGDVLFGTVRPALQSHAAVSAHEGRTLVASTGFSVIRANSNTDPRFLAHVILSDSLFAQARRAEVGSNYPAVNETDVKQFLVPCPPLVEQRRIAKILDTIDEAIHCSERLISKMAMAKDGLLQDLVTCGIDRLGNRRNPLLDEDQFVESLMGMIPRTWQVHSLGSVLRDIEQGWSPDCPETPASAGQWGVLKTSAVAWGGYIDSANKTLPPNVAPRPEYEVRPKDVLMTRAGPNSRVGVVAIVDETQGRLMLSDKLYRLVPGDLVMPAFLAIALSGAPIQRHLSRLKTGLAESQTNISQDIVRALPIALPPISEQERIIEVIGAADREVRVEHEASDKLRHLKQGLMDDLLTGRVRVNVDEDAA